MSQPAAIYQQLRSHLAYLNLGAAAEALPSELDRAQADKLSYTVFLERLLGLEVTAVQARRLEHRMRFASFPAPWRLEDFDFDAQPSVDRKLIEELATLRFLEDATNVLLIGPPENASWYVSLWVGAVKQSNRWLSEFSRWRCWPWRPDWRRGWT